MKCAAQVHTYASFTIVLLLHVRGRLVVVECPLVWPWRGSSDPNYNVFADQIVGLAQASLIFRPSHCTETQTDTDSPFLSTTIKTDTHTALIAEHGRSRHKASE